MLKITRAHLRSTSPRMSLFTTVAVLLQVFLAANAGLVERTYTKGQFYKVAIVGSRDNYRFCGGTVIGSRWLLTEAYCLISRANGRYFPPSEVRVRIGQFNYDVQRVIPHSGYMDEYNGREYLSNNIALIKTTSDMVNARWSKISLPTTEVRYEGNNCTMTGWNTSDWRYRNSCSQGTYVHSNPATVIKFGRAPQRGPFHKTSYDKCCLNPENLLVTTGTVLADSVCEDEVPKMFDAHNNLCVRKNSQTACLYDEGGPLICEDKIAGIAKSGGSCPPGVYPSVYTNVFWHLDWIRAFTGITE